jgi:hypothetical protein
VVRFTPPGLSFDFGIDNAASYNTSGNDVKNSPDSRIPAYAAAHLNGGGGAAGMPFLSKWICFGHGSAVDQDRG